MITIGETEAKTARVSSWRIAMIKAPMLIAIVAGVLVAGSARADTIPYPTALDGTPNNTTYNFTAAFTGTETLYIIQKSPPAAFTDELSVNVGGTGPVDTLLNAQSPTLSTFSFNVVAGQSIVFSIAANGQTWYSNALGIDGTMQNNIDGYSHVYSTLYTGGINGIPVGSNGIGTYVGFEDQVISTVLGNASELNYDDVQFVMSEVAAVPELSTWAMLIVGFAGLGFMGYRRSRNNLVAASA